MKCPDSCFGCSELDGTCTSCKSGLFLESVTKKCVEAFACPDGTYPNANDNTCTKCNEGCKKCSSATVCSLCDIN